MRAWAAQLISDPAYLARLGERLLNGQAGRVESLLWQYACGKPVAGAEESEPDAKLAEAWARILSRQAQAENGAAGPSKAGDSV